MDWLGGDIAATLHTSSYTPNQDTHDYFNDLTNQLSTANGYTNEDGTGTGLLLGTKVNTNTNNVIKYDAADEVWTSSGAGFTARIRVLSDVTSNVTTTDPVICWMDFGADATASGGGNASGIATVTATDATGFP